MSPYALLLKPDLYWFTQYLVSEGHIKICQWLVYTCFCATVMVVCLGLQCKF